MDKRGQDDEGDKGAYDAGHNSDVPQAFHIFSESSKAMTMRIKPADGLACLSFMIQPPPLYVVSMRLLSGRRTGVFAGAKMDCGSRRSDDETWLLEDGRRRFVLLGPVQVDDIGGPDVVDDDDPSLALLLEQRTDLIVEHAE